MPGNPLFYRARIRNAADSSDDLVVTSLDPSGTNPYLTAPPTGDGASLDILTGAIQQGALQIRLADAVTSGPAVRILTAILADTGARQQLLARITILEESVDGVSWTVYFRGVLRRLRLVSAMEWELTIGDVTRAESSYLCFSQISTAFPKGINLIGEPIPGGWGPIPPIGQTTFKVLDKTAKRVRLAYQYGPLPPDYVYKQSGTRDHFLTVNRLARPFAVPFNEFMTEDATVRAYFPRLVAEVASPTTGVLVGTFTPVVQPATPISGDPILQRRILEANSLLSDGVGYLWLSWPAGGAIAQPANGTLFAVRVYPLDVSELNPLHLEGHPIDIWTALYTQAGIPYSATAATALRAALGDTLRFRGRITTPVFLSDFVARAFGGPLGIGVRVAADGTRELIAVRDLPTALPGTTITVNDLRSDEGVIFDLNDTTVVNRVTWKIEQYAPWDPTLDGGSEPNDRVVVRPIQYQTINGDPGAIVGKEQTYEVGGQFYDDRGADVFTPIPFFAAQAARVFDRFGRGGVRSEVQVLRGISPALGSYVVLDLPHLPAAVQGTTPVSQRGQAPRAVQVERVRPDPAGPICTVLDIGRNALPGAAPTITLAASAFDPFHWSEVTVTNAAALAAAGIERVNFQMGTGGSSPAGGIDFANRSVADLLLLPIVSVPPVAGGETVWIRAQAKDTQAMFAGPWTAWQSITLTPLPPPSGLTLAAGANDTEKIVRWTLANNFVPVLIRWKLTGDANWAHSVSLPMGSVEYTIRDLIPGGGGISGEVFVRDYAPSPGQSAAAAFSFTPGVVSPSLPTPWSPAGWCGPQDDLSGGPGIADGSFGLDVTAAKWPAYVEVEVALETGVGTGVYGTYLTQAAPLVQQGYRTRTRFSFYAGSDRLRRKLRARHTLPGYTASSYTAEVVVAPWVAQKAILPAVTTPTVSFQGQVQGTIETPAAFLYATYTPPTNPHFDYIRYRFRQRAIGQIPWGPYVYSQGGRDGDDYIPVDFGMQIEVQPQVVNTDGIVDTSITPLVVNAPKFPRAAVEAWSVNVGAQPSQGFTGSGAYQPAAHGDEPNRILLSMMPNEHCVRVQIYAQESVGPAPNPWNVNDGRQPTIDLPVEPAAYDRAALNLRSVALTIPIPFGAIGPAMSISIVPIDRFGRVGDQVNILANKNPAALPVAPTAPTIGAGPAVNAVAPQTYPITVTPQDATRFLRVYRNGRYYADLGPYPAGVPVVLNHPVVSSQVDRWEYCHAQGGLADRESARTAFVETVTNLLKLAAPAGCGLYVGGNPGGGIVLTIAGLAWTVSNPLTATGIVRRATSLGGPWTEVATFLPWQDSIIYTPPSGTWYFDVLFRCTNWTDSASFVLNGGTPIVIP